ncbi:MAG: excinuclease ABC subunit UvrA [Candidatus Berkelbacteria bacterium]|nr:excinuclease ABC subunit UvrA [Candidatus Berkelbacteria bacterium]
MNTIRVLGAREHNLKNVSLEIPRDKLVVITGLSGSGKSSLAFDTIYAEGQRKYVESLSSYARQFLGMMEKPDVDSIEGLSPAISIDQKSASRNPRSTVGTITEIYDYLRLMFARIGVMHCPKCGKAVVKQTISQIVDQILLETKVTSRIAILAPIVLDKKGEHKDALAKIQKSGFGRVRLDGTIMDLSEALEKSIDKNLKHTIEIVVDRLIIEPDNLDESNKSRLYDSIEKGLKESEGKLLVYNFEQDIDRTFSESHACPDCGISMPEILPRSFSFNSPHGACQNCQGLGVKQEIEPKLILPNHKLTINEGAIRPWSRNIAHSGWYSRILAEAARKHKIDLDVPIIKLSKEDLHTILYGTGEEIYRVGGYETKYEGVIPNMERRYKETDSEYIKREIEKYMLTKNCPVCGGMRLKREVLGVKVDGKNISEVSEMDIEKAFDFFNKLEAKLSENEQQIAKLILKEIRERLNFLINVGLSYLTIGRNAATLAGGEAQRIRLATQIGSGLMGVLYILDEPSIGLHQRDNDRLLETLKNLRDLGNTVIVVEHDEDTILAADWVIDVGPGAGEAGGHIVCEGTPESVKKCEDSITGQYLSGKRSVALPKFRRPGNGTFVTIKGAKENNLKNVEVKIPLNTLTCVTGVSGSGKSTLINDILAKHMSKVFHRARIEPGKFESIEGLENLNKVIDIDQSPIGKTPRSNSATYTGIFNLIRDLFAATSEAKMKGYKAGRFSFNVKGGRCEKCRGEGVLKIEMHFLPDVYITCEECKGKRYNQEALDIKYKGKNIADVLAMTTDEALVFFKNIPSISQKLQVLSDVGLGYIKLGQPATTLSGGEAQRIKLATELAHRGTGKTFYILDEPTTGLHFEDVNKLIGVLSALVDKGNTVLVIEHNLDVIKSADYLLDLGPEGGDKGGMLVASGTPEEVSKVKKSYTGQYLSRIFHNK